MSDNDRVIELQWRWPPDLRGEFGADLQRARYRDSAKAEDDARALRESGAPDVALIDPLAALRDRLPVGCRVIIDGRPELRGTVTGDDVSLRGQCCWSVSRSHPGGDAVRVRFDGADTPGWFDAEYVQRATGSTA